MTLHVRIANHICVPNFIHIRCLVFAESLFDAEEQQQEENADETTRVIHIY